MQFSGTRVPWWSLWEPFHSWPKFMAYKWVGFVSKPIKGLEMIWVHRPSTVHPENKHTIFTPLTPPTNSIKIIRKNLCKKTHRQGTSRGIKGHIAFAAGNDSNCLIFLKPQVGLIESLTKPALPFESCEYQELGAGDDNGDNGVWTTDYCVYIYIYQFIHIMLYISGVFL